MDTIQSQLDDLYLNIELKRDILDPKLPIEYVEHERLSDVLREDLEIGKTKTLYDRILPSQSMNLNKWCSLYTKDTRYLKQTQKCIKHYSVQPYTCDLFKKTYEDYIGETNFIDKYQYVGFKMFQQLNESSTFLHCLSLYNLTSPIFSLISPLIMLVIPFMLLKMQSVPITIDGYIKHLSELFKHTSVYQLFFNFRSLSFQNRLSAFFSLFIYLLQVYNNVISCMSFYRNITTIYDFLSQYESHVKQSISLIDQTANHLRSYSTYRPFVEESLRQKENLQHLLSQLQKIQPCESIVLKIGQIGVLMQLYYDLFMNETYHKAMQYTFFLHDYNMDMLWIYAAVRSKKLKPCKYGKKTVMNGMYYLALMDEPSVRNDIDLKTNLLISGPNASGKTTVLKSLLLNAILSQQWGYGCYEKA